VSVPIDWEELRELPGPATFNVNNVPARLASLRRDPWRDLPKVRQSIAKGLKRLT
jgi:bifunctional non-homologous end joining protein LigD